MGVNKTSEDAPGKGKGIAEHILLSEPSNRYRSKGRKINALALPGSQAPIQKGRAGSPGDRIVFNLMWRNWKLPANVGNSN